MTKSFCLQSCGATLVVAILASAFGVTGIGAVNEACSPEADVAVLLQAAGPHRGRAVLKPRPAAVAAAVASAEAASADPAASAPPASAAVPSQLGWGEALPVAAGQSVLLQQTQLEANDSVARRSGGEVPSAGPPGPGSLGPRELVEPLAQLQLHASHDVHGYFGAGEGAASAAAGGSRTALVQSHLVGGIRAASSGHSASGSSDRAPVAPSPQEEEEGRLAHASMPPSHSLHQSLWSHTASAAAAAASFGGKFDLWQSLLSLRPRQWPSAAPSAVASEADGASTLVGAGDVGSGSKGLSLLGYASGFASQASLVPLSLIVLCFAVCVLASYHACNSEIFLRHNGLPERAANLPYRPTLSAHVSAPGSAGSRLASARSLISSKSLSATPSHGPTMGNIPQGSVGAVESFSRRSLLPPTAQFLSGDRLSAVSLQTPGAAVATFASAPDGNYPLRWLSSEAALDRVGLQSLPASVVAVHAPGQWQEERVVLQGMPLCAALVLPSREGKMEVSVQDLLKGSATGGFSILGPLGKAWGRATVVAEPGHRSLRISRMDSLVASLDEPGTGPEEPFLMEISGADGALYGTLASRRGVPSIFEVRRAAWSHAGAANGVVAAAPLALAAAGRPVEIVIDGDPSELRLTATAGADGRPLASCIPRGGLGQVGVGMGAEQLLELHMQRGVDTALLLSCMLAALVFCPAGGHR